MCTLIHGETYEEKFDRLLTLTRKLADNPEIVVDEAVYQSEKATGSKNRALAYLLKTYGINAAFEGCTSLASVTLGANLTKVSESTFTNCRALAEITIPDSVTAIEKNAFSNCVAIQSIIVGNGVTSIGEDAFANCSMLQSITLGEAIESIGKRAFYECNALVGMICRPETPPTVEHLKLPEEATVYVPQKMVKTYKKAMGWSNYAKQIKRIRE